VDPGRANPGPDRCGRFAADGFDGYVSSYR
jgi:hypothetical protein